MKNLPRELQHLQNLIDSAEDDTSVRVLRKIIKSAADSAPSKDVIRIARTVLQCGVAIEQAKRSEQN